MPVAALPLQPVPAVRATLNGVRDRLRAHYRRLGRASRRLRFLCEPSAAALDRIADRATPDLLLEVEQDGAVRGVFEAYATGSGRAEVALSVEEAYQGQGLGRRLFAEGLRLLAARGFRTVDLMCRRDNAAVLGLVRGAGGRVRFRDGEALAEIDLGRVRDQAHPSPGRAFERAAVTTVAGRPASGPAATRTGNAQPCARPPGGGWPGRRGVVDGGRRSTRPGDGPPLVARGPWTSQT